MDGFFPLLATYFTMNYWQLGAGNQGNLNLRPWRKDEVEFIGTDEGKLESIQVLPETRSAL